MPDKQKSQVTLEDVTLVTRNNGTALLELLAYGAILYFVTHPDQAERTKDRLDALLTRIRHRVSVWRAYAAIQSLPDTSCND